MFHRKMTPGNQNPRKLARWFYSQLRRGFHNCYGIDPDPMFDIMNNIK
jgi:hypothetical protein